MNETLRIRYGIILVMVMATVVCGDEEHEPSVNVYSLQSDDEHADPFSQMNDYNEIDQINQPNVNFKPKKVCF